MATGGVGTDAGSTADDGVLTQPEAARSLEEIDQLRRRVINVVGHELRTPITTLRGLSDQLEEAADPGVRARLNDAIQRNARRAERLLDDLLLAAGISTALPVGDQEPVDAVGTGREVWDALGTGRRLSVEGPPVAMVLARSGVVDRILQHLLDNAAKYGDGPVCLRTTTAGSRVVVDIESTGQSLGGADLLLAFELFYRGEGAVTAAPGLGIGLPVARVLARHEGGEVHLLEQQSGGVVVRLELRAATR